MPSSIRALVGQESGDDRSQMSDMHTDNVPSVSASGEHGCYVLHQDFSTLKEELTHLKSRIADAETRQSFAQDSLKPAKSKGIFSKPKKFLQKLFSKKVSNSASSKDSDTQSTEQPAAGEPVNSSLRQRHSMVWATELPNLFCSQSNPHFYHIDRAALAWSWILNWSAKQQRAPLMYNQCAFQLVIWRNPSQYQSAQWQHQQMEYSFFHGLHTHLQDNLKLGNRDGHPTC